MEGVNVTVPDESNFFRWEVSTSKKVSCSVYYQQVPIDDVICTTIK